MSERRNDERGVWRDEDLLEWLLDEAAREGAPREELESRPEVAARLGELEAFLGDCRETLREESRTEAEVADDGLVDRILLATTREDLSWRGDLRLVGGFLRQRLQASLLLRVVAASLLLHVVALPVLAYYTLVVIPERRLFVDVRSETPELPYAEQEPEPEREVSEPAEDDALGGESLARTLRLERLARAGRADLDGSSALPSEAVVWHDSLGLVLWCEQLMDELEGPDADEGRKRLLGLALIELRRARGTAGADPGARLAASAWLRAGARGWAERDEPLTATCEELLEGRKPLTGSAWVEAYREADRAGSER